MSEKNKEALERLLEEHRNGDPESIGKIFTLVYPELKEIAKSRRKKINGYDTLNPTSILNEAYLKVANSSSVWASKNHFFSVMSLAMRHFILTYIERHHSNRLDLEEAARELGINDTMKDFSSDKKHTLLTIAELMKERERTHPVEVEIVNSRIYLGYTIKETAKNLEIGEATVNRKWKSVCSWMRTKIEPSNETSFLDNTN